MSVSGSPPSRRPSILMKTSIDELPAKQTWPDSRRSWTVSGWKRSSRSAEAVAR